MLSDVWRRHAALGAIRWCLAWTVAQRAAAQMGAQQRGADGGEGAQQYIFSSCKLIIECQWHRRPRHLGRMDTAPFLDNTSVTYLIAGRLHRQCSAMGGAVPVTLKRSRDVDMNRLHTQGDARPTALLLDHGRRSLDNASGEGTATGCNVYG